MRFVPLLLLAAACSKEPPAPEARPEPAPAAGAAEEPPVRAEAEPAEPTIDEQVRGIVRRMSARTKCNDLTGCPMVNALAVHGADAAPAIAALYEETSSDAFWRLKLIEALGRIRSPDSAPFLLKVAKTDDLDPARIEALFALARLGRPEHRAEVEALAASLDPRSHRGVLLAAAWAIAALGDREQGRALITEHLVVPEKTLRWDQLRPGVYAVGQLRLTDLRSRIEAIARRADPFVRREAVRALGAMRDRGAIGPLIEALKDPVPGVRDEALRALRTLTGVRHRENHEQWARWWKRQQKKSDGSERTSEPKN